MPLITMGRRDLRWGYHYSSKMNCNSSLVQKGLAGKLPVRPMYPAVRHNYERPEGVTVSTTFVVFLVP